MHAKYSGVAEGHKFECFAVNGSVTMWFFERGNPTDETLVLAYNVPATDGGLYHAVSVSGVVLKSCDMRRIIHVAQNGLFNESLKRAVTRGCRTDVGQWKSKFGTFTISVEFQPKLGGSFVILKQDQWRMIRFPGSDFEEVVSCFV